MTFIDKQIWLKSMCECYFFIESYMEKSFGIFYLILVYLICWIFIYLCWINIIHVKLLWITLKLWSYTLNFYSNLFNFSYCYWIVDQRVLNICELSWYLGHISRTFFSFCLFVSYWYYCWIIVLFCWLLVYSYLVELDFNISFIYIVLYFDFFQY